MNPTLFNLYPLSLHDALPILPCPFRLVRIARLPSPRRSAPPPRLSSEGRPEMERLRARAAAENGCRPGMLALRSEEHTSELQSQSNLVCRLLLEKKKYCSTTQ